MTNKRVGNREAVNKYRKTEKGKKTRRLSEIRYDHSEKGRIRDNRTQAKRNRNFGWIQMFDNPFDNSEIVHWHHITDAYVVALPRDLHLQYLGKFHREKTMEIVKQIYLDGE